MNPARLHKLLVTSVALATLSLSCSSSDNKSGGSVDVEKSPYQRWDENTAAVFTGATANDPESVVKVQKLPGTEREVDGQTVATYVVGMPDNTWDEVTETSPNSATVEAGVADDGTITVTSFTGNGIVAAAAGLTGLDVFSGETVNLAEPITVNMEEMTVGETREAVINATMAGIDIPVTVSYGPVEEDVSIETARGHIVGCRKFHVSGQYDVPLLPLSGQLIEGDGYYHKTLGLVAWDIPSLGIGLTMAGSANYGSATEGYNVIQKTQVLTATDSRFSLSTMDRAGEYDADKESHAKMLLELRWADETIATTHDQPDSIMTPVTFGTLGGMFIFGFELVESPVSVFFPEENGNGFRYWYAFVNEGAKNQTENGISYDVIVSKDTALPDLRVTARIGYTILPAGTY
jgi:hypothetical protein